MGGQEVDIGCRKGEPRAAGTGRYKGEKVNMLLLCSLNLMSLNMRSEESTRELVVAEMRMLRWMSGVTKLDRIRNERIRGTT